MRLSRLREYQRILSCDYGEDVAPPALTAELHARVADDLRSLLHGQGAVAMRDFFFPPCVLAELANWPVVYVRRGAWYVKTGQELVIREGHNNQETALNLLEAISARAFRQRRLFATRSDHVLLTAELAVPRMFAEQLEADQIVPMQPFLPKRIVVACCRRVWGSGSKLA